MRTIKVSYKSLIQQFHPCNKEFIKNVCHGACCEMHSGDNKTHIPVLTGEENGLKKYRPEIEVKNGILSTGTRCIFQDQEGLCAIHDKSEYPFACRVVPFALNKNNVLIIRNRWRLMKCFRVKEGKVPAYKAFRFNLEAIFDKEELGRIIKYIEIEKRDCEAFITGEVYKRMKEENGILKRSYENSPQRFKITKKKNDNRKRKTIPR